MSNDVITLISVTKSINDYGDTITTEVLKDVLADVKSVGMREHYQALSAGLKPEYVFVLADYYDYDGQEYISYNGARFKVERTYRSGLTLEITVTKDVKS